MQSTIQLPIHHALKNMIVTHGFSASVFWLLFNHEVVDMLNLNDLWIL